MIELQKRIEKLNHQLLELPGTDLTRDQQEKYHKLILEELEKKEYV